MDRRHFVFGSCAALATAPMPLGAALSPSDGAILSTAQEGLHIVRPLAGYSPQIGTLVSMGNWIRWTVERAVDGLDREELDYLYDSESNTIGALLFHLAAIEVLYQAKTFEGRELNASELEQWSAGLDLGEAGRAQLKGHDLDHYLAVLDDVRAKTLVELRTRDDEWLMKTEPLFDNQPTNYHCMWFHVIEHEANHRGQIAWLKSRLPGREFANATRG